MKLHGAVYLPDFSRSCSKEGLITTWEGDGVQTDDVDVSVEELVVLDIEVMVLLVDVDELVVLDIEVMLLLVDVAMLVGVSLLVTET